MDQAAAHALVDEAPTGQGWLAGVLEPLQVKRMPLADPPPRDSRFGSPLKLAKVHWVRPEVVVEVTYLTWTRG